MKIVKTALFTLFSLFLIFQSYQLINQLLTSAKNYNIKESIFIALLINLYITGIFAFPGFVFPTNKLLPERYYKIKNNIILKRIYRILKVNIFRKALLLLFWGYGKNRKKFFDGTKSGIHNFIYQSKQSEFGHTISFITIFIISIIMLVEKIVLIAIFSFLLNIVVNLYPVIIQRFHRIRIQKIINS